MTREERSTHSSKRNDSVGEPAGYDPASPYESTVIYVPKSSAAAAAESGAAAGADARGDHSLTTQSYSSLEKIAARKNTMVICCILLTGAMVIAVVLGVTFGIGILRSKSVSSSDEQLAPPASYLTDPPSLAPIAFETTAPESSSPAMTRTSQPTVETTPLIPAFAPTRNPAFAGTPTRNPVFAGTPTRNPAIAGTPTRNPAFAGTPTRNPASAGTPTRNPASAGTPTRNPAFSLNPASVRPSTPLPTMKPTMSSLEIFIRSIALDGGSELDNIRSYQRKAYAWLALMNPVEYSLTKIRSRYAAACVYYATFGVENPYAQPAELDGWANSENWMTRADECTWFGITCNADGYVTDIDLHGNNVTGTWPAETILWKDTLVTFDIGNNNVWNVNEEVNFLGQLTNLVLLDIGVTYFDYNGIPPALSKLVNLVHLDVAYTLFFGPIRGPVVFSQLQNLEYLAIGGNAYNSSIPSEIYTLPFLTNFYCDNAFVAGTIDFVLEMPVIFELWLDMNPSLGGTIPTGIGSKADTLESLSLSDCGLTGTIPTEVGSLVNMQQLWLFNNKLTGSIPSSLGALTVMTTFDVSENLLVGSVPDNMCQSFAGALTVFDVVLDVCADCDAVACCCCTCCTSTSC